VTPLADRHRAGGNVRARTRRTSRSSPKVGTADDAPDDCPISDDGDAPPSRQGTSGDARPPHARCGRRAGARPSAIGGGVAPTSAARQRRHRRHRVPFVAPRRGDEANRSAHARPVFGTLHEGLGPKRSAAWSRSGGAVSRGRAARRRLPVSWESSGLHLRFCCSSHAACPASGSRTRSSTDAVAPRARIAHGRTPDLVGAVARELTRGGQAPDRRSNQGQGAAARRGLVASTRGRARHAAPVQSKQMRGFSPSEQSRPSTP
jgi:hypothetical protein